MTEPALQLQVGVKRGFRFAFAHRCFNQQNCGLLNGLQRFDDRLLQGAWGEFKHGVESALCGCQRQTCRSEEHTSELQSLMRISYAVFCLKKKNKDIDRKNYRHTLRK